MLCCGHALSARCATPACTQVGTSTAHSPLPLPARLRTDGKMGPHMANMKVGEALDMKGPIPKYPYSANIKKHIGMVAGGSGITPMLQASGVRVRAARSLTRAAHSERRCGSACREGCIHAMRAGMCCTASTQRGEGAD